ncbi:hypothetical protein QVD17_31645 [Tagetes erecta]|uniref:Transmembrane protein n=1 Tax=Tagetes erecta TaxID=13708 RepID=A0AAD8K865_TARER|nr:hypothetical protein QVD17_31645 [Tagetes erecta]
MVKRSEPLRGSINKMDVGVQLQMSIKLVYAPFNALQLSTHTYNSLYLSIFLSFSSIIFIIFIALVQDLDSNPSIITHLCWSLSHNYIKLPNPLH